MSDAQMIRRKTRQLMSAIIGGATLGLLGLLIFVEIPEANRPILNIVLGALMGSLTTIVSFFFGSSENAEQ
jgi:predicted lipid-binding transport protein (Tim44 family)